MNATGEKLYACSEYIRSRIPLRPAVALVLGSGLGDFADKIDIKYILPYSDIESFPVSTISGHAGRYVFGYLNGVPVCAMQGRVHLYEGYPVGDVVLPIRVMGLIGAHSIILTNAAGGINKTFHPGMFMLLSDHISSFVPSPLTGENIPSLGVRFPDMSAVYDPSFRSRLLQFSSKESIDLREGVYLQVPGTSIRNADGNQDVFFFRCRRSRNEHGVRSNCRSPHGHESRSYKLYHQHGRRSWQKGVVS